MNEASTIGLDTAKTVFHARGADASGRQVFRARILSSHPLSGFPRISPKICHY